MHVEGSTAVVTALVPELGYEKACDVARQAAAAKKTPRQIVVEQGVMTNEAFDALITPEAVCRLGSPDGPKGE